MTAFTAYVSGLFSVMQLGSHDLPGAGGASAMAAISSSGRVADATAAEGLLCRRAFRHTARGAIQNDLDDFDNVSDASLSGSAAFDEDDIAAVACSRPRPESRRDVSWLTGRPSPATSTASGPAAGSVAQAAATAGRERAADSANARGQVTWLALAEAPDLLAFYGDWDAPRRGFRMQETTSSPLLLLSPPVAGPWAPRSREFLVSQRVPWPLQHQPALQQPSHVAPSASGAAQDDAHPGRAPGAAR